MNERTLQGSALPMSMLHETTQSYEAADVTTGEGARFVLARHGTLDLPSSETPVSAVYHVYMPTTNRLEGCECPKNDGRLYKECVRVQKMLRTRIAPVMSQLARRVSELDRTLEAIAMEMRRQQLDQ